MKARLKVFTPIDAKDVQCKEFLGKTSDAGNRTPIDNEIRTSCKREGTLAEWEWLMPAGQPDTLPFIDF